jgi:hypothetical protein
MFSCRLLIHCRTCHDDHAPHPRRGHSFRMINDLMVEREELFG